MPTHLPAAWTVCRLPRISFMRDRCRVRRRGEFPCRKTLHVCRGGADDVSADGSVFPFAAPFIRAPRVTRSPSRRVSPPKKRCLLVPGFAPSVRISKSCRQSFSALRRMPQCPVRGIPAAALALGLDTLLSSVPTPRYCFATASSVCANAICFRKTHTALYARSRHPLYRFRHSFCAFASDPSGTAIHSGILTLIYKAHLKLYVKFSVCASKTNTLRQIFRICSLFSAILHADRSKIAYPANVCFVLHTQNLFICFRPKPSRALYSPDFFALCNSTH